MRTLTMLFGDQLLKQRKKLKLSAEELADRVKISRSYITLMENNKRLPSKKLIPRLAEALKIKTNIVINWYLEDVREKLLGATKQK